MSERTSQSALRERFESIAEDRTLQDWVIDLGPFALLAVLMIGFSIASPVFFTFSNLVDNVLRNSTILLLVSLAGTFPILQQSIDLSIESMVGITGVIAAILISDHQFGALALLVAVLAGTVLGALNGIVMTGGTSVPYRNPGVRQIATGHVIPGVPNLVVWGLLIYGAMVFVAFKTPFGRYCYALGENENVADLSGVDVDRYKIGAFVVSGLLCGTAGALLTARTASAAPGMGSGLLLQSIAAIVMGGTALTGGVGGPHRTLLGVLVIGVLANGMNLVGIQSFVQDIVLGFVVIIAVAMSMDRRKIDIVK
ncbi:ABC transporter permease [Halobacteriales archaeon QH_1_68_42]|nr:MAG: ABC transporter permease [Halobacteriales archaeon QH_1_68_42]